MGCVSVTLIVNVEEETSPESNPATELELLAFAARYVHGAANDDCDTECGTLDGNQKVTKVPTGAVILAGLKTNFPWKPTSTLICPVVSAGAEGVTGGADEVGVDAVGVDGPGAG